MICPGSIILKPFQKTRYSINASKFNRFISQIQRYLSMASKNTLKNYYAILGVPENASLFEIENAYEKLAAKWHPDKHKQHRKTAESKFHDIAEAFQVLSDRNKRSHYDELLTQQYSLEDAHQTFQRFFNENGLLDQSEEKFFNQHYPNPLNNYYQILGVSRNATLDDIRAAYRKLALKYHPKSNPGNAEANAKFIEVNQAYNAICNEFKRENYDNLVFGEMVPLKAHNIFDDFFVTRWPSLDEEIRPLFHNKWTKDLDRLMIDENDKNITEGETVKTSAVYTNKNGKETGKTVTTKKVIKDGKANEETTEDYLYPTGERKVTKTITHDGKVETKEYTLKKGEELPKELTN